MKKSVEIDIDALMSIVRNLTGSEARAILDAVAAGGLERDDLLQPAELSVQPPIPALVVGGHCSDSK